MNSGGYPTVSQVFACLTDEGGIVASDSRVTSHIGGVKRTEDNAKKVSCIRTSVSMAYGISGDWASIDAVDRWLGQNQKAEYTCFDAMDYVGTAFLCEFTKWHSNKDKWKDYGVEGLFVCKHSAGFLLGFMSHDHDFKPFKTGSNSLMIGVCHDFNQRIETVFSKMKTLPSNEDACKFACQIIEKTKSDDRIGGPIQIAVVSKSGVTFPCESDILKWSSGESELFLKVTNP